MIGMYYVLNLKDFNMNIPYIYTGDGLSSSLFIKGTIENGWYNVNPNLGAPFGLEMYDYPLGGDNFQYLIMKFIALFSGNYVVVMNTYYLLTFPLCMIAAFIVLKNLKVNFFLSLSISLLYTFLPYHIIRTGHLFLLGYYMVPLVTMVVLWVAHKENFILTQTDKLKFRFTRNRYLFVSILICILIGSTGAYYAFFSCFFLLVIGLISLLNEKNMRKLLVSIILIFFVGTSLLINISPSIYSKLTNPKENSVSSRNFEAAETYGLKIAQLLLPTTNHNVEWIKEKKDEYNSKAPLVNENDTSSLGVIGSIGFLMLILHLFMRRKTKVEYNYTLSLLNISSVLLGTIGGFGVLFAALVSAQIRSYNRISVYIAFFSFLYIALNLNYYFDQKLKVTMKRWFFAIFSLFIIVFGIYDQTSHPLVPSKVIAEEYNNDADFVHLISDNLPEKSMIFQIPYVSFPEGDNIKNLGNYDLLKGYIHSRDLSWSFGNMKDSFGDRWMKEIMKLPIKDSIEILAKVGYSGIYIDRNGYTAAYADKIEMELKKLTNQDPLVSKDNELVFFDLTQYTEKLKSTTSLTDWNNKKNEYLSSVIYKNHYSISGDENWQLLENGEGFKIVQTDHFSDLPLNQEAINLVGANNQKYSFDDSFPEGNHYSNRHWEDPSHFVISLSNKTTGWGEDNTPTKEDISNFFKSNNHTLMYTSDMDTGIVTFLER
jgi:phosphoglycerol transferase